MFAKNFPSPRPGFARGSPGRSCRAAKTTSEWQTTGYGKYGWERPRSRPGTVPNSGMVKNPGAAGEAPAEREAAGISPRAGRGKAAKPETLSSLLLVPVDAADNTAESAANGRATAEAAAGQGADAKTRARADNAAAQGPLLGFIHIGACGGRNQKGGHKGKYQYARFHNQSSMKGVKNR